MIPSSRTPSHELLARAASHPNKAVRRWLETALKVHNEQEVIQMLARSYRRLQDHSNKGQTVLHLAAHEGHDLIVAQLLKEEPSLANATNKRVGGNVLEIAATNGKEKVVAVLLAMSPQLIHEVDSRGNTPLHLAALAGQRQTVAQLLATADPSLINKVNSQGWTALHCAVVNDCEDVMDVLLAVNPQLVFVVGEGGETVLHLAGRSNSRSKAFYAKLLALNPEALRAADLKANTIFSLVVERDIDCAIDLLQWQLTLDEIVSAFTQHNKSSEDRLRPIVEEQCACLAEFLLNQDNVMGIVFEFLGLDNTVKNTFKHQKLV